MKREEWEKICPHCGDTKDSNDEMCDACKQKSCPRCGVFTGDGSMCEDCQRHLRKPKKEYTPVQPDTIDKVNQKSESVKGINKTNNNFELFTMVLCLVVLIVSTGSSFFYFSNSLWLLINIGVSLVIGLLTTAGVAFAFSVASESAGNDSGSKNFVSSILMFVFAVGVFSMTKGCFYVSPEKIAARAEAAKADQLLLEKLAFESKKLNAEISEDFAKSKDEIKVYGTTGVRSSALSRAKTALEQFAHDPDSVTGVEAVGSMVLVRMKQYPQCRYALNIQFRAKNRFGALVLQNAVVLFDGGLNAFSVLEKSPF